MSVSLCVLRFEIAESGIIPSGLDYLYEESVQAAYRMSSERRPSSEASVRFRERSFSSEEVKTHRGNREFHDIVVETHATSDSVGASPDSSTLESVLEKKMTASCQIGFFSGNPFVEITKGILHLFKENHMTSLTAKVPRSEMVCILAVPASTTTHDLLQFLAPCSENINHVRIIRDSTPNQYMVLIKFNNQAAADEYYKAYNGARFNSIELDVCHLVYIAKVETTKELGCLPLEGHTELPTCSVCLERMDESVDGILTILCNHSFHAGCLSKWGDSSCPVCRHCQTPEISADNRCSECHSQESLWMCLICGHVGCGRYVEGHAYNHFLETSHTYAMQLGNNRVWDYAGDNYVHRLLQNKADGKLVELNEERSSVAQDEKLDSMQLEYTYLVTSQLESQRLYFEEKITRIEQETHNQLEDLKTRTKTVVEEYAAMKRNFDNVNRDKLNLEKRIQLLNAKIQKSSVELSEEKEINECLRKNQEKWQERVKEFEESSNLAKKEAENLKEQLRDVMFYLEAQNTLGQSKDVTKEELEDSQIVVNDASASTSSKRHRRRKNQR
ncbi:hypothetical protein CHUAL_013849 [Chamberlinius hualienensis]